MTLLHSQFLLFGIHYLREILDRCESNLKEEELNLKKKKLAVK